MKRLLILSILIATTIAASADPPRHKKTFTAPAVRPIQPKPTPPIAEREAQGVLPRTRSAGSAAASISRREPFADV